MGIIWVVPPPSNSDHKDYYMFSRGIPINLHFPLLQGGGHIQGIIMLLDLNKL